MRTIMRTAARREELLFLRMTGQTGTKEMDMRKASSQRHAWITTPIALRQRGPVTVVLNRRARLALYMEMQFAKRARLLRILKIGKTSSDEHLAIPNARKVRADADALHLTTSI